ncbi:MAG TPA: hypothetical protein VG168_00125 [Bryobacteraceae bacterium]|nr:hypothetical protein [Bryobacteraceae bacterium]
MLSDLIALKRMGLDLETLKAEMQAYMAREGMTVFHGYSRSVDSPAHVYWDIENHPDFREFLEAGRRAGAKLVVFYHRAFSLDAIDEALDHIEDSELPRDEKRSYESRLRELQAYEGFTCAIELSFDLDGRVYLFEVRTEWYEALNDLLAEIDAATEDLEDDEDQGPISGYFSKN